MINASEADWFHIDIMDGVLFPIFLTECQFWQQLTNMQENNRCSLMIVDPDRYIKTFAALGTNSKCTL
jgi:ribulose-phosphate 3-epimerase